MSRIGVAQVVSFIVLMLFQVTLLRNFILFNVAFCFVYISGLLLLPIDTNRMLLLGLGFVAGLLIDIFYDSLGMHAAACVFIMYIRNYYLSMITPQGGYDSNVRPTLATNGTQWFLVFVMPMVFVHQVLLFFMEAGGFSLFWYTLWKALASTFLTTLVIVLVQLLFPDRKRI
jgi:hypothetical protein